MDCTDCLQEKDDIDILKLEVDVEEVKNRLTSISSPSAEPTVCLNATTSGEDSNYALGESISEKRLIENPSENFDEPLPKQDEEPNSTVNTKESSTETDNIKIINNNVTLNFDEKAACSPINSQSVKTCDVASQTSVDLLESSTYRKFSLDLKELQLYQGYISVDSLEVLDSNLEAWAEMIVMQLKARDSIVDILHTYLIDLLQHGKSLEMDLEYLRFKVEELTEQTKLLKHKLRIRKRKLSKMTQTDVDHNHLDDQSNWYCQSYYNYYDYYGEHGKFDQNYYASYEKNFAYGDQQPGNEYGDQQPSNEYGDQQPSEEYGDHQPSNEYGDQQLSNEYSEQKPNHELGDQQSSNEYRDKELSQSCEMEVSSSVSLEDSEMKIEEPMKKEEDTSSCTSAINEEKVVSNHHKTTVLNESKTSTSKCNKHPSDAKHVHEKETDALSCQGKVKSELSPKNTNKNDHDEVNTLWNSDDIVSEVKAVAEKVVQQSGYIFIEEAGMYYDHTSGYYYDPKTSLYYDSKTGTYFYFDHSSNTYQFYGQVDVGQEDKTSSQTEHTKKRKIIDEKILEKEEGECSDSTDESECNDVEGDISQYTKSALPELIKPCDIAPSLRLMVLDGVEKGSLHIVTLDGGTIGREKHNLVVLKSASVSKVHAEIAYRSEGPDDHHYYIKDIGSNNGTYIKGRRLSESRVTSEETELGHGWEVQCGEVTLACHIHPGLLTCNTCEPGLLLDTTGKLCGDQKGSISGKKKEKERRRQNKAIRKKFSINFHDDAAAASSNLSYKDRAHERRDKVGSDNPYEKTEVASIEINLPSSNKGFKLLQKMGWSEGQGLGVNEDGRTNAVVPKTVVGRTGLGSAASYTSIPSNEKTSFQKRLDITQERYNALSGDTMKETTPASFQPINFVSK